MIFLRRLFIIYLDKKTLPAPMENDDDGNNVGDILNLDHEIVRELLEQFLPIFCDVFQVLIVF